jgi:hypothetical protein
VGVAAAVGAAGALRLAAPGTVLTAAGAVVVLVATIGDPRIGLGALAFAMVLSPELGGVVSVRADDLIIGAALVGWVARQAAFREPLRENPLLVPMVLLGAAGLASLFLAIAGGNIDPFTGQGVPIGIAGLHWLKRIEYFAIVFLVAQTLRTRAEVGLFAGLLLAAAGIIAVRGALQVALHAGEPGFRLDAPFDTGEANTLGEYLMFTMAVALGLLLAHRSPPLRLALAGVIALQAYAFLYTFSRGAYIGLVVVVLAAAVLRDIRLLVFVGALVLLVPARLPSEVTARLETIPQEIATLETSDVGSNALLARVDSYRVAARRVTERPFMGYGPGVVSLARIESQYAKEAVDGGVVGLVLFLWFLGRAASIGRDVLTRGRDRLDRGIGLGYLAGLAGMAVAGLGAIPFTTIRTMEAFCFATGLTVVLWRLQREEAGGEVASP